MSDKGDPSQAFIEALSRGNRGELSAFPKTDRHCHSLLSASLESIRAWSGKPIKSPPARMVDFNEMRAYLHGEPYPVIFNKAGFEFTAERAIIESVQDGVQILEMSIDVNFIQFYGAAGSGFLDFIQSLASRYRHALKFRPEIGVSKDRDASAQCRLAEPCIDSGLFGSIDLYGNEHAEEPEAYRALYNHAKARNLKLKAHVGEFGDAHYVERTIHALDLQEIQHGVAAAASKPLMDQLRKKGIRLNVCPSSNVALSVAPDLAHHPIRILIDNGIRVSINSDDKTVFGKTVSEEYLGLYLAGTLNAQELDTVRRDSLLD
jgi:adenosine deaminase